VSAGLDGRARVFDAAGRELRALGRSHEPLSAAAFAPDGRTVLTASLDGTATLWDLTTGQARATLDAAAEDPDAGAVTAAGYSPDGRRVVTGHADRSVRIWDASSGEVIATLSNDDPEDRGGVASAFFSPDGERVLIGFGAGWSLLCGAGDLAPVLRLSGRGASATASPFSPDGRRTVTVGGDGSVLVSDVESGDGLLLEGHARLVLSTVFSRDGARLVTAAIDGTLRVWDLERGETTLSIQSAGQGEATWAGLSPDGRWIVAAYADGALRLHPATAESAMERACAALAYFGRTGEVEGACP
jgi:WD40 repeat protein